MGVEMEENRCLEKENLMTEKEKNAGRNDL